LTYTTTKVITAKEQYPLRRFVLGQGLLPDMPIKPNDDHPDTLHVGVYIDNELVSIASLYPEAQPNTEATTHWRLRGMATLPEHEGKGYGKQALHYCIEYARSKNGTHVWCNARENAIGFYQNMNFQVVGEPYQLESHGERWMLILDL
jgi:GNAT superfamily N-acetyltransferase